MVEGESVFKFPKQLIIIYATIFVDSFGCSFIMPILPFYAQELNGSAFELGVVISIYSLMQIFSCVIMGTLSDKYGRNIFLILSLFGSWTGPLLQSFAPSMLWFILARAYTGILAGSSTLGQAYIADVVPVQYRANYLSQLTAIMAASYVIGPALGGLLSSFSNKMPFWIAGACALVLFILSFFFLKESNQVVLKKRNLNKEKKIIMKKNGLNEEDSKRLEEIKNEFETMKQEELSKKNKPTEKVHWNKIMILTLFLRFCNDSCTITFSSTYLLFLIDTYQSTTLNNSILICTCGLMSVITPLYFFPFLHDKCKLSVVTICMMCSFFLFIGYALMTFVHLLWFAYISCNIMYLGGGTISSLPSVILSAQTPAGHQGNVLSIGVMVSQASYVVMPLVTNAIYEVSRIQAVSMGGYLAIAVAIFSSILFFLPGGRTCEDNQNEIKETKDIESKEEKLETDSLQNTTIINENTKVIIPLETNSFINNDLNSVSKSDSNKVSDIHDKQISV